MYVVVDQLQQEKLLLNLGEKDNRKNYNTRKERCQQIRLCFVVVLFFFFFPPSPRERWVCRSFRLNLRGRHHSQMKVCKLVCIRLTIRQLYMRTWI